MERIYRIDGGDTFEGSTQMFEDCFGGPSTHAGIITFCVIQEHVTGIPFTLEWNDGDGWVSWTDRQ